MASSRNGMGWLSGVKQKVFRRIVYPEFKLSFSGISDWFIFSLFIMPSYFGIRLAFFDLTAVRFFEILLLICIWKNEKRKKEFINLIKKCSHTWYIGFYMFIVLYTNLIHPSLGTIFYWLMNIVFVFYLIAYLIFFEYGIEAFLNKLRVLTYILAILSPMELILGKSPFMLLNTLGKGHTGVVRFGSARISGNCTTANGYGMYICILLPIVCYSIHHQYVDIMGNLLLVVLLSMNIFLSGSRLSVGALFLILFLCFIMQKRKTMARMTLIMCIALPLIAVFLFAFKNVGFVRSILCTIFSAVDEVLGTSYAINFGADKTVLNNSTYYRTLLYQNTIFGHWLNPLLGRGGKYRLNMFIDGAYIQSCDNYYVAQYIAYAFPGLFAWLLMSATFLVRAIKNKIKRNSDLSYLLALSIIGYFISLWFLDQLQTFSYIMAVFAIIYASSFDEGNN